MNEVRVLSSGRYGYDFIPPEFLPPGKDEYWRRNEQAGGGHSWRALEPREIEILVENGNTCPNWGDFLVTDPFDPALVRNSAFYGLVRLGSLRNVLLRHHDFCVPSGIRNSRIVSCDIGSDTAVQDCGYISHYLIGDSCILSRIDEMQTTNHAKFGNGVLMEGEGEEVRVRIDVMNESGGRAVLPFAGMIPADAFLWAAYRDDRELGERLSAITQEQYGGQRGRYGVIGSGTVIKSTRIIKDVTAGDCAYIKGANKLKNLTILSSAGEPSQIGEGVELVNGIVGYGSHAFYGVKAVRFVMGSNTALKYGARLIHSVLGDNSTVSCCELLNNLLFPFHEQHHNNSFLIASLVQGMSNMPAGATIGSNHTSRANDGEIRAGRGFWPGLAVSLKHSSRFASFVIIAGGNYPRELDIPLPFSLVSRNVSLDRLEVMPAYFWMYNLYALERNSWKAADRDRRKEKRQRIETDYLAPDTAEEIMAALSLLEGWMAEAGVPLPSPADGAAGASGAGEVPASSEGGLPPAEDALPVRGLERGDRDGMVLKPRRARNAYRDMLRRYGVKTLALFLMENPELSFRDLAARAENPAAGPAGGAWVNLGGQIVPAFRVDGLRREIREGTLKNWEEIHAAYDRMAALYPGDRLVHAWKVLAYLRGGGAPGEGDFREELEWLILAGRRIAGEVRGSRARDFEDPFRGITYRNGREMEEVAGTPEDNFFVRLVGERTGAFEKSLRGLIDRLYGGAL
jgi:NDP-sugar pyrophosphorylase family protein